MRVRSLFAAVALALFASACNAAGTNQSVPLAGAGAGATGTIVQDRLVAPETVDMTSLLKTLTKQVVIGSTVDPTNGDQNPYGLTYVATDPYGTGKIKKGDLLICNFNNKANVQGTGTTVEVLNSAPGSKPTRFAQQSKDLLGCGSMVLSPLDQAWLAASATKDAASINPTGKIAKMVTNKSLVEPWGSAYAASVLGYPPGDGLFVGDASSGKIVRLNLGTASGKITVVPVISGFQVNHGKPGSILGPSGMQYKGGRADTLFIVDGVNNTVIAVSHAYRDLNSANEIVVGSTGKTFTGPKAQDARVIFSGSPLNGPISSTLLPNGNLIIGNTGDASGTNLMVEITSTGVLLATRNVDKGAAGALFGIVSTGSSDANSKIYFNDDNANNVQALEK
jgi:hypothetical protein